MLTVFEFSVREAIGAYIFHLTLKNKSTFTVFSVIENLTPSDI